MAYRTGGGFGVRLDAGKIKEIYAKGGEPIHVGDLLLEFE